jgi:hypothetical protein
VASDVSRGQSIRPTGLEIQYPLYKRADAKKINAGQLKSLVPAAPLKIQTPPTKGGAEAGEIGWDQVPIGSLLCIRVVPSHQHFLNHFSFKSQSISPPKPAMLAGIWTYWNAGSFTRPSRVKTTVLALFIQSLTQSSPTTPPPRSPCGKRLES